MSVLTKQIEYCLRNIPATRDSDITLTIEVWRKFYTTRVFQDNRGHHIYLRDLYDLPREDNIKRIRAKFNSEGKYYPTSWKVARKRGIKEDQWRTEMGYPIKQETKSPSNAPSYMDAEPSAMQERLC